MNMMRLMKRFLLSCCVFLTILRLTPLNQAQATIYNTSNTVQTVTSNNPYDMNPWLSEKLQTLLDLPNCPWVKVIEWRTPSKINYGGPSITAQKALGDVCAKAVKNFPFYVKSYKYNIVFDASKFHQSLCLIPALEESEGLKFRNLNDYLFRFKDREKSYDNQGKLNMIWGYTNFHNNTTYVRNDVLNEDATINKKTITIFAHELYHAMSWQFHVNDAYHNDTKIEEEMAIKFTVWLGIGK